ncbi:MAG: DUF1874 domain-containing protein [Hydrogenobacter thermophilus]|uniref:STIV orfB116 family protein n=1 Tax=Hydrogenobacter thermophilus TaxID=940 RepID=UPI001C77796D|nr:DUF1874 domain-containing protein [Hydrogenobacter thermophilus]QWK20599.1 MAG: DUF1874 domain-containing protein [Hydrogenobacter thermophilus]
MPSLNELSPELRIKLLKGYLATPSKLTKDNLEDILNNFPFLFPQRGDNPNYLALKIMRERKDLVNLSRLVERMGLSLEDAEKLLNRGSVEVMFPVSNGRETFMNRAFLIPDLSVPLSPDGVEDETLEILRELSGKGFFLIFEKGFDVKTRSFMLSVYAGFVWGDKVKNVAFTGVLSPEGKIEAVEHLKGKIDRARAEGVPLIFPSPSMSGIRDLRRFLDDLTVPLFILPGKSEELFLKNFPFPEHYIREVFHLRNPLSYTQPFDESPESFYKFAKWLDSLTEELKGAYERFLKFDIALTSNPLVFSFYAGVCLTKTRIPVRFFAYESQNKTYREAFRLESDKPLHIKGKVEDIFEVNEPKEIESVFIGTKSKNYGNKTLSLVFKEPLIDERKAHLYAYLIATYLRSKLKNCTLITLETSNSFAFALGYFLEDYKCLALTHRGKVVHRIGGEFAGNLYLLNAFSLSMIQSEKAFIEVEKILVREVVKLLETNPWVSYISHESTAKVLSRFLGREVQMRREKLALKPGDRALVFQIEVRPKEGQVFTEEEIDNIIENGLFSFRLIKIL